MSMGTKEPSPSTLAGLLRVQRETAWSSGHFEFGVCWRRQPQHQQDEGEQTNRCPRRQAESAGAVLGHQTSHPARVRDSEDDGCALPAARYGAICVVDVDLAVGEPAGSTGASLALDAKRGLVSCSFPLSPVR